MDKKITIRVSPELHEALTKLAERERRSLHMQVVWLLEKAVEEDRQGR